MSGGTDHFGEPVLGKKPFPDGSMAVIYPMTFGKARICWTRDARDSLSIDDSW